MTYALDQVLGYVPLTEGIKLTSMGVPRLLPPEFYEVKPLDKVLGDRTELVAVTGERRTARLVRRGSPAYMADLRNIANQPVILLSEFEELPLDPLIMKYLREHERWSPDDKVFQEATRQTEDFGTKFQNSRDVAAIQMLKSGVIYWDTNGNLLP
jgi:hypothetical protein